MASPQSRALDEKEQETLTALLRQAEAPGIYFAHGVFTAVATAPLILKPEHWLPLTLGQNDLDEPSLRLALQLLMREYAACNQALESRCVSSLLCWAWREAR